MFTKYVQRSLSTLVLLFMSLMSSATYAETLLTGSWDAPGKVTYINAYENGFKFKQSNFAPTTCNGEEQFYVPWSAADSKQLYSLVLTAFATQKSVGVLFDCQDGLAVTKNIDIR